MSDSKIIGRPLIKLPLWHTAGNAYGFVFRNLESFFVLAAIPLALTVALWFLLYGTSSQSLQSFVGSSDADVRWAAHLFGEIVIWVVFAVAWHRLVLLGSKESDGFVQFRFGRREFAYLLYSMLFALPLVFVSLATDQLTSDSDGRSAALLPLLIALAALVVVVAVVIRCSLLFPAVAVDSDRSLAMAWVQLKGSTWRMAGVQVLTFAPFIIAGWIFTALVEDLVTPRFGMADDYLFPASMYYLGYQVVSFFSAALTVSAESFAFRQLTGWAPPMSSGRPDAPAK